MPLYSMESRLAAFGRIASTGAILVSRGVVTSSAFHAPGSNSYLFDLPDRLNAPIVLANSESSGFITASFNIIPGVTRLTFLCFDTAGAPQEALFSFMCFEGEFGNDT